MADGRAGRRQKQKEVIPKEPTISVPWTLVGSILLVILLSFSNVGSQLSLHPLYGGTTTSLHFTTSALMICLCTALLPKLDTRNTFALMSIILAASPLSLYVVGSRTSAWVDPFWGPIVTQGVGATPVLLLGVRVLSGWLSSLMPASWKPIPRNLFSGFLSWLAIARADQVLWENLPFGGRVTGCTIYLFSALAASIVSASLSIRHLFAKNHTRRPNERPRYGLSNNPAFISGVFLAIPLLISINVQTRSPCATPTYPYFAANNSVRILDRAHSVTGLVVIAEYLEGPFRFMRCDQSILGGRWISKSEDGQPTEELTESIYSAFILQEAVRLIKRPQSSRSQERVLNIGLGVGIAVGSFIQHGLSTTVVEIDPAVYYFARQYFGLLEPDEVYFEDARTWVHKRAEKMGSYSSEALGREQFDFIVHDCFSGGAVPQHLFTTEFWDDLKTLLDPTGVVAVNFAGQIHSDSARGILATLLTSFTQCRVLHDHYPPEEALKGDAFLNMVFFCTPSTSPITFRAPKEADSFGTFFRNYIFNGLGEREVPINFIFDDEALGGQNESFSGWVLTDATNRLGQWQESSAVEHWTVMRKVLPHAVWNVY